MAEKQKVVIVGAGPVGALAALYSAVRGDKVEVYELRGDLRDPSTIPLNFTRSINLALSERGINAMREANSDGLIDSVLKETIPMHGRMIHGKTKAGEFFQASQAYDVHGRHINAIDRSGLNARLLDELSKYPNAKLSFSHKLTGVDFNRNIAWFEDQTGKMNAINSDAKSQRFPEIEVPFDLLIGADGAHSASRFHMMKFARVNYSQEYIDTLWCEFTIPPSANGDFLISPNHLHIWPGSECMFIAIPSMDKSFTCTLFAPSSYFASLAPPPETPDLEHPIIPFFTSRFPGVVPALISSAEIVSQFTQNPHLPLISLTLTPHHYSSSGVLLGDAAHAMVPFYGQGMNAGLEDVRILFHHLDSAFVYSTAQPPKDAAERTAFRAAALQAYTEQRAPDAYAISSLALQNYIEMRSSVTSPLYKARKMTEEALSKYLPALGWETQYARVSFGNERYSVVGEKTRRQGKILARVLLGITGLSGLSVVMALVLRFWVGRRLTR